MCSTSKLWDCGGDGGWKWEMEVIRNVVIILNMEDMSMGEDRISQLSDPILHDILTSFPTKDVVATSILSRRWRYLWMTVPKLKFCHKRCRSPPYPETERFMSYVDEVLRLHDLSCLKKFSLEYYGMFNAAPFEEFRIRAWISKITEHRVQDLHLSIMLKEPFVFPNCLFTCSSLIVLKLALGSLKLGASVSFPTLKILQLREVTILDGHLIEKLFCCSQVLEELHIQACTLVNAKNFCVSAPALKCFTLENCELAINAELENYCGALTDVEIMIHAPKLVFFSYKTYLVNEIIICKFDSPMNAYMDVPTDVNYDLEREEGQQRIGYSSSRLLQGLTEVKELTISGNIFQGVEQDLNEDSRILETVPAHLMLHLKEVRFNQFEGHAEELYAVKFFLKNARDLHRITIRCLRSLSLDLKTEVEEMEKSLTDPSDFKASIIIFEESSYCEEPFFEIEYLYRSK
ncbi:hypothetical protein GIB67_020114 [Kingdonia uniflora]|uniref:Uncharacterized protein n=1 Tax=Kingdonia uniflora TaxID=39325 RepID=A0A7J7NLE3_9MAGN|nr:hypothetical protein GIB67_020114 [Kingdonia uniflora]